MKIRVDPHSLVPPSQQLVAAVLDAMGWPDASSVLVQQDTEVLRIDLATGARTVLFPRQ